MKKSLSRRNALKLVAASIAASTFGCASNSTSKSYMPDYRSESNSGGEFQDSWVNTHDRTWLGGEYWANPMEDWRIIDGAAECISRGGNRSVHWLTHQIVNPKPFFMSVNIERKSVSQNDGGAGLRLGVQSEIKEYKSNCFIQQGFDAGIIGNDLVLGDKRSTLQEAILEKPVTLVVTGEPIDDDVLITIEARLAQNGLIIGKLTNVIAISEILGNISVVSNFNNPSEGDKQQNGCLYRFSQWQIKGDAFNYEPEQRFGPILWAMYTLNNTCSEDAHVLKLSALTGPMGENDNLDVMLQTKRFNKWQTISRAELDKDAWVANFKVKNWDQSIDQQYRLVYLEKKRDGTEVPDYFEGVIKSSPVDRELRMAALTCQNDYAFPYEPVAKNVVKLNPDLILFSGDQIYENHGGFGLIRSPVEPAILNYLRKYYQFGWAFRDAMRNSPTVCLPDDHDVMQGNLWGEGGKPFTKEAATSGRSDNAGGYIQEVRMINVVHHTHTSHHPDPVEPQPTPSGISTYYTQMIYGEVSFAILADRQWKSGPEQLDIDVGVTGEGESPTYVNPKFDSEELELLGHRQEQFLQRWSADWSQHKLKAVLSQTVFSGISTHQPSPNRYLKYDFDSSAWPPTARNRAISIMRQSNALHICGDTHLASLSQYGVYTQRDSNWAFCTPAIAAGWPRWWRPDDVGLPMKNRPSHNLPQTGEYLDSFGNKVYVYAVGNPLVGESTNRYVKAHEKGSGFGFIVFNKKERTYTTHAFRFLVDAVENDKNSQFSGWPVVIRQKENSGLNQLS